MDKFSVILKELRKDKGLKQKEVSSLANVPYSSYCKWEQGTREPTHNYLINLAKFFQVSTDFLLGLSDDLGNITIVTTQENTLNKDERTLLAQFKKLDKIEKDLLLKQLNTWTENK